MKCQKPSASCRKLYNKRVNLVRYEDLRKLGIVVETVSKIEAPSAHLFSLLSVFHKPLKFEIQQLKTNKGKL